jgi:hypothetical protein
MDFTANFLTCDKGYNAQTALSVDVNKKIE